MLKLRAILSQILVTFLLLQNLASACADTVTLKTGRRLEGQITAETGQSITIQTGSGRFTFPMNRVSKVTRAPAAQNELNKVAQLLAAGQVDAAVTLYDQGALSAEFAPNTFESLLLQNLRETAGSVMCSSATASLLAEKYRKALQPHPELLLFTAALVTEANNFDQAHNLLRRIALPLSRPPVWPASTLSDLLNRIATGAVRSNRGDIIGTTANLTAQLLPSQPAEQADPLQTYAQIDQLRRHGDYIRACTLFKPEHFAQRPDLFVPLAERVLSAIIAESSNASNLAALESARITLFPHVSERSRRRGMALLISRLIASGRTADARLIADSLSATDPDEGAVASHLVEFHITRASLPPESPLEKYKLAAWAREMGLLEEAKPLFLELRRDARFEANAALQLTLIENSRCTQEIARLRQLFDKGTLANLESEVHAFIQTSPPDAFAQQARDLLQLANFEKWSSGRLATGQATAELQQAERLALRRDYDAALVHLNKIQAEGQSSEAAQKARALRGNIYKAKQLDARPSVTPVTTPGSTP